MGQPAAEGEGPGHYEEAAKTQQQGHGYRRDRRCTKRNQDRPHSLAVLLFPGRRVQDDAYNSGRQKQQGYFGSSPDGNDRHQTENRATWPWPLPRLSGPGGWRIAKRWR